MNYRLLIFLFVLHITSGLCQVRYNPSFQQLESEHMGIKQINRFVWDSKGLMWGSYENGLFNYNGYSFKTYTPESSGKSILSKNIQYLYLDSKDRLWIAYRDTICLTVMDLETETFRQFNKLPQALITNIKEDSKGNFWVLTWGEGLYKLNDATGSFQHYLPHKPISNPDWSASRNRMRDFLELPDGRFLCVYFTNESAESYEPSYFNPSKGTFELFPVQDYIRHWSDSIKRRITMSLRISQFIHQDRDKNIWIGTYSGLIYFDMKNKSARRISGRGKDDKLNLDNARVYAEDNEGNLWVGTPYSGIMHVNIRTREASYILNNPKIPNSLSDNRTRYLGKDSDGNIWVSTAGGILNIYNAFSQRFSVASWSDMDLEYSNRSEQRIPVNQVLVSPDGTFFVTSEKGVSIYDANANQMKKKITPNFELLPPIDNETLPSRIQDIGFLDSNELVVTAPHFPAFMDKAANFRRPLHAEQLRRTRRMSLMFRFEKNRNELFFSSHRKDSLFIYTYNATRKELELFHLILGKEGYLQSQNYGYRLKDGDWLLSFGQKKFGLFDPVKKQLRLYYWKDKTHYFPDSTIRMGYVDTLQRIWFGTDKGLILFDKTTGKSTYYNSKIGLLPNEGVNAMILLKDGNWWIALDNQIINWNEITGKLVRYTSKMGLKTESFLGSQAQNDALGRLYFATFNGELYFNPSQMQIPPRVPETHLSRLFIKDSAFTLTETNQFVKGQRTLNWNENFLTFECYTDQLYTPSGHHYRYRLIGLDTNWTNNGVSNTIRYTNLAHGHYTLEVSVTNAYGILCKPFKLAFTINPPFWETWWFYLLCGIVVVFTVYSIIKIRERAYRRTQLLLEQKIEERTAEVVNKAEEIRLQKEIIQEKNNELTDSIYYAQRIQQAILPGTEEIAQTLDHFIFFRPKDIVSGDFYWYSKIQDSVLWAVVDCTGHGVPGGFMSMLGSGLLNQIVNEELKLKPDEILNQLRDRVIMALKQSGAIGENKDGMDISLCRYIPSERKLQFAGANNGLYIVRKGQLMELPADKQPIGIYVGALKPFVLKEMNVEPGDCIYMSSDGYVDQFGGPKGKKYKSINLEKMIIELSVLDLSAQQNQISATFDNWKGLYEQLDDVCVFGVKL